jgi:hypothetical protein
VPRSFDVPPIARGDQVQFQPLVMHWREYAVRRQVPLAMLNTMQFSTWEQLGHDGEGMVVELSARIMQHEVARDRYEVPVRATRTLRLDPEPTSWLQMWKRDRLYAVEDALTRWLRPRWPVRTREVTWDAEYVGTAVVDLTRLATYPDADVPMPENFGRAYMVDVVNPLSVGGFRPPRRRP